MLRFLKILQSFRFSIKSNERFHTTYHIKEDEEKFCYTDIMEWHLVELPKLPPVDDGTDLYDWVKFLTAEKKEEFEMAANENEYIKEAYNRLEIISQDEQKRMEYTARQKAVMDHNTLVMENYTRGKSEGIIEGEKRGKAQAEDDITKKMLANGFSMQQIAKIFGTKI